MRIFTACIATCFMLSFFALAGAEEINAAQVDTYLVPMRGDVEINIDANLSEWDNHPRVLVMGEDTWEPLGGNWDGPDDLTARLRVLYDENNLYFALQVADNQYAPKGSGHPWEDEGVQIAIDTSAGKIDPGWPNKTTYLYNFAVDDGWQKEAGPFMGDAIIEMKRDEATKQTIYEWQMPSDIVKSTEGGVKFKPGMEIAFAIIVNDSDEDAIGQTGWVGWGNHTIVFGKNPEEMKTLVLGGEPMAVNPADKLATSWGKIKKIR
ncbi:hypothetical protein J7M22_07990 [Candidatus Poribacteria bacterium]|nr:hypothetical protein [Candidatus Poribacteria bacterium]